MIKISNFEFLRKIFEFFWFKIFIFHTYIASNFLIFNFLKIYYLTYFQYFEIFKFSYIPNFKISFWNNFTLFHSKLLNFTILRIFKFSYIKTFKSSMVQTFEIIIIFFYHAPFFQIQKERITIFLLFHNSTIQTVQSLHEISLTFLRPWDSIVRVLARCTNARLVATWWRIAWSKGTRIQRWRAKEQ